MEIKSFADVAFKAEPEGTFTALIATFNKADKNGDILRPGAFADTLAQWRRSGARIPVIFSHAWRDPMQHIGEVDPTDVRETPTGLEARQAVSRRAERAEGLTQLQRKTLREWSRGYVVSKPKRSHKARELLAPRYVNSGPCRRRGDSDARDEKRGNEAALAAHRRTSSASNSVPPAHAWICATALARSGPRARKRRSARRRQLPPS